MTIKYECDRCHRQTSDEKEYISVTTDKWIGDYHDVHILHYCKFCSLLMINAIDIVNSGAYGGSLEADAKIGTYPPDRENYDPLMMKEESK